MGSEMLLERLPFLQTLLLIYFSIRKISHDNLIASEFTHSLGRVLKQAVCIEILKNRRIIRNEVKVV